MQTEATLGTSPYTLSALPVTTAKQALLIDVASGDVLFEKNADQPMSPSSMTKIATACFVARKLQTGKSPGIQLLRFLKTPTGWKDRPLS